MNLPPFAEPDPNSDNPVDRARGELNEFLARFYHELGVYAVAAALDAPLDDETPHGGAQTGLDRAA